LPEDTKLEVAKLIKEISDGNSDIKTTVAKLSGILNDKNAATQTPKIENEIETEIKDEDDDEASKTEGQDPEDEAANTAGLAGVHYVNDELVEIESGDELPKDSLLDEKTPQPKQNIPVHETHHEVKNETPEPEKNHETPQTESEFTEVLDENENPAQNNFSDADDENQNQNFDQARDNFSTSRNQTRSRNDTRRTANETQRTQNERSYSGTDTRRTESRNDFQSFFEGVLDNRRVSQTSPQPLNLRGNVNFNQSETLRDGLVNVVRFIRADGVQRANIIVDPPALGRISVELASGTSGVEASIKVANEQIRQLVQDQLSQLRMNLAEQGVQVAEFTVDVQQDSQREGRNSQDENSGNGRGRVIGGVEEEEAEEFRVDLEDGLLYWVA
ncbi:MAG: flagellar hook-length control protein FliK, partial [Synergistaceae bacterium]|nr:flagellar hook-length control protein FliK [Synergistaceae bacterium]